jgi:hypothetical protein
MRKNYNLNAALLSLHFSLVTMMIAVLQRSRNLHANGQNNGLLYEIFVYIRMVCILNGAPFTFEIHFWKGN